MRVAFVSDIHGNLPAWKAVRGDILAQDVDRIICLGDIVGYGPSPAEVLTDVYSCVHHFVLGNHDAVVAGLYEPDGFNQHARDLIELSKEKLGEEAVEFFGKVPLTLHNSTFGCFHGHPAAPGKFAYVFDEDDARLAWEKTEHRLMFVGHTHLPALHQLGMNDDYTRGRPQNEPLGLDTNARYIMNPGSVGMPRDKDFRASYLIYDSAAETVCWQRVAYDIDRFIADVKAAYDRESLTNFLLKKVEGEKTPLIREVIDFDPGESAVSDEVEADREIGQIQAEAARWRWIAGGTVAVLLVAAVFFTALWQKQPQPENRRGEEMAELELSPRGGATDLECLPEEDLSAQDVPAGWSVRLGDAREQSVAFSPGQVIMRSAGDHGYPMQVTLPQFSLEGVRRMEIRLKGERSDTFVGERPALVVDHVSRDGSIRQGVDRAPLVMDDTVRKKYTISAVPGDLAGIILHLRGRFSGELRINELTVRAYPDDEQWLRNHGPLDINAARGNELQRIPGIGEKLAREIQKVRQRSDGYEKVDDLLDVSGIGRKSLESMRQYLTVGEYERDAQSAPMERADEVDAQ
ncbi:MAG: metallophosphoesterase family protein [Planctomycetota bacterium]